MDVQAVVAKTKTTAASKLKVNALLKKTSRPISKPETLGKTECLKLIFYKNPSTFEHKSLPGSKAQTQTQDSPSVRG